MRDAPLDTPVTLAKALLAHAERLDDPRPLLEAAKALLEQATESPAPVPLPVTRRASRC